MSNKCSVSSPIIIIQHTAFPTASSRFPSTNPQYSLDLQCLTQEGRKKTAPQENDANTRYTKSSSHRSKSDAPHQIYTRISNTFNTIPSCPCLSYCPDTRCLACFSSQDGYVGRNSSSTVLNIAQVDVIMAEVKRHKGTKQSV